MDNDRVKALLERIGQQDQIGVWSLRVGKVTREREVEPAVSKLVGEAKADRKALQDAQLKLIGYEAAELLAATRASSRVSSTRPLETRTDTRASVSGTCDRLSASEMLTW